MSAPLFSIATPTRNALDKLRRCIGSVRGQSNVPHEHLVQDAQSSDGTAAWLAEQHDILGVSEADAGMYDAINRAWSRATGQYLSWLNADEQYLPGTLAKVSRFFDANPEVDVVFGDYIVADAQGRPIALRQEIPFRKLYVANGYLNAQSCTLFFRRRLMDRGLLKLESRFRYAADKALMLRLADQGAIIRRIPDYLSLFGIDGTNLSTHPRAEQESEIIRGEYGAFANRHLRKLTFAARRIERLIGGAYRPRPVRYRYAIDDRPHYVEYDSGRTKGRYHLGELEGRAEGVREVKPS